MHNVSTTEWIEEDLKSQLRHRQLDKRPNRIGSISLRAAFKLLRRQPKYNLIGDYPIIFCAATTLKKQGLHITRKNVLSTMNASKEFKGRFLGKNDLIVQLL